MLGHDTESYCHCRVSEADGKDVEALLTNIIVEAPCCCPHCMILVSTEEEEEEELDSVLVNTVPTSMDLVSTGQIPVSTAQTLVLSTNLVQNLVMSTNRVQILVSTVPASMDLAVSPVWHTASTVQTIASTVPVSTELVHVHRSTQKKEQHSQMVNIRAAVMTESMHSSVVGRNHRCTLGASHRVALVAGDTARHHAPVALQHDMVVDNRYHCRPVVVVRP